MKQTIIQKLLDGTCVLGVECGSTRIKAIILDDTNTSIASGSVQWENQFVNGHWTYSEKAIWNGIQDAYAKVKQSIFDKYGIVLHKFAGIGFSGMMHGYIALDKNSEWLVPFRTWRNTTTEEASKRLSDKFMFHIPQRWTVAHFYQAILNNEKHIDTIDYVTTLAGYIHFMLTGNKVVGIGEASGIFPINTTSKTYYDSMIKQFDEVSGLPQSIVDYIPQVVTAGEQAGILTKEGVLLIDPDGDLESGIPFAPPEGDAGTGMVATNAIKVQTGNISAGTSVFAMVVLDKPLSHPYDNIDIVTTPVGDTVAMVHVNNCTSDINAWVNMFRDVLTTFGVTVSADELYATLFEAALDGDKDLGNMLSYNYFSGEHITGFSEGRPILIRKENSSFTVANLMKLHLFSSIATLKMGMTILDKEGVQVDALMGHGGLFKTPVVGQRFVASALNIPVTTMVSAEEGGPFGMAVLTNYMVHKNADTSLREYLENNVFQSIQQTECKPDIELNNEFENYMTTFVGGLPIEKEAIKRFK